MSVGAALAGIAGSITSAVSGWLGSEKEREEQRYLQDRAHELDIQKWNMMKDYEKPSAQMQRFKEAGLNPDLIYGQQSSAPSMPESPVPDAPNIASAYNSAAGNLSDSLLIASQINKNNADAENAGAQADLAGGRNAREDATLPLMMQEIYSRIGLNKEETKKAEAQGKLIYQKITESAAMVENLSAQSRYYNSQSSLNETKLKYADQYYQESLNNLISQTNLNDAQKQYFLAQEDRLRKSLNSYISLLKAQAREANASAALDEQEKGFRETKFKNEKGEIISYNEIRAQILAQQSQLLRLQIQYYPAEVMNGLLGRKAAVIKEGKESDIQLSQIKSKNAPGNSDGTTAAQRARDLAAVKDYQSFLLGYCNLLDEYLNMVGEASAGQYDIVPNTDE